MIFLSKSIERNEYLANAKSQHACYAPRRFRSVMRSYVQSYVDIYYPIPGGAQDVPGSPQERDPALGEESPSVRDPSTGDISTSERDPAPYPGDLVSPSVRDPSTGDIPTSERDPAPYQGDKVSVPVSSTGRGPAPYQRDKVPVPVSSGERETALGEACAREESRDTSSSWSSPCDDPQLRTW